MAEMNWNEGATVEAAAVEKDVEPKKDNKKLIITIAAIIGALLLCCILVSAFGGCAALMAVLGQDTTEVTTETDSKYVDDNDLIEIREEDFTVEELNYIDFIRTNTTELTNALEAIQVRAQEMGNTGFAVTDDIGWLAGASDDLGAVREISDKFIHFDLASVPERFRGAHTLYVLAVQDFVAAMNHFQGAADGNNEEALNKYLEYLDSGADTLIKAHIQFATARDGVAPDLSDYDLDL